MFTETDAIGMYYTRSSLEFAVNELKAAGFQSAAFIYSDPDNPPPIDVPSGKPYGPREIPASFFRGLFAGSSLGLLFSLALYAALADKGPLMIGTLLTAFLGILCGGMFSGLLGMWAEKQFIKASVAKIPEHPEVKPIRLSVHCSDLNWVRKAEEILLRTGAEDVSPVLAQA